LQRGHKGEGSRTWCSCKNAWCHLKGPSESNTYKIPSRCLSPIFKILGIASKIAVERFDQLGAEARGVDLRWYSLEKEPATEDITVLIRRYTNIVYSCSISMRQQQMAARITACGF
ncbi:hypothetical protein KCU59_g12, partial [Aureobasidium melanogenum]